MTIINVDVGGLAPREGFATISLWVCQCCSTAIRSEATPAECYESQGGCMKKLACYPPCDPSHPDETTFLGPFPESAKAALEIDTAYRKLRLEDGLNEPDAIGVLDREREEPPEIIRDVLRQSCLLDEWPVGWREEEWPEVAKWMTSRTSNIGSAASSTPPQQTSSSSRSSRHR